MSCRNVMKCTFSVCIQLIQSLIMKNITVTDCTNYVPSTTCNDKMTKFLTWICFKNEDIFNVWEITEQSLTNVEWKLLHYR